MFPDNSSKKKVFVGMSGGVDSSVSALLLQKAGFDVTGVFIRVWQPENGDCTWKEDRRDAMRVSAHLGIKFLTLDLKEEYKQGVVDYMIGEYAKGRTPNPDVMCNKEVKFGAFMDFALKHGADYVATGHYAQTKDGEMFEGVDSEKDQSYFLWTLSTKQLEKILFPIGHLQKTEVRAIAEKAKIPVAKKKDSQGVCFIGHIDMKDFIKEHVSLMHKDLEGLKTGDVLDINGNVIGKHDGALLYTIGERHGLALNNHTSNSPRFYVIAKDVQKNTITVAEKEQINAGAGMVKELIFDDIHFISQRYANEIKVKSLTCMTRARYRQQKEECEISFKDGKYHVLFTNPQESISAGQSLVFYTKDSTGRPIKIGAKTLGGVII